MPAAVRALAWIMALWLASAPAALAEPMLKIGVLSNMGSIFAHYAGAGSVVAARLAIEDAGMDGKVTLLSADHRSNPDLAAAEVRDWFDTQGVEAIFDVPSSSISQTVGALARERRKLVFFSTSISDRLTEEDCNPYVLAWTWDVYSVAHTATMAQLRKGIRSWFIIAQDYPGGQAMEAMAQATVEANGGKVLGVARHPLGETEYASYLEEARNSGAEYIAFTSGGADLMNAISQLREPAAADPDQHDATAPPITQQVGMMYTTITEVNARGLQNLQGLEFVTAFYWDRDDQSRAFARRFFAVHKAMPTMFQAGVYSAVLNYLKAVQSTGSVQAATVRDWLRKTPINDAFARNGRLLANGRLIHDMLLARIKAPEESRYAWDYYDITGVVPATEAFRGMAQTKCALR